MEKTEKNSSKQKWTNREYHVEHNKDVEHQDVKMYCDINQFPNVNIVGPHNKPHGVHGLGKNYHMCFDTKIGHGTYGIFRIPCACTSCTYSLEQPRIKGFPAQQQPCYKYVKY